MKEILRFGMKLVREAEGLGEGEGEGVTTLDWSIFAPLAKNL